MGDDISLAILAYQRPLKLSNTLTSLACQSIKPYEVIVIDQDQKKSSQSVVIAFRNRVDFTIRYIPSPVSSYSFARNLGLKLAKKNWVAFIDDDCIAHYDWLR